VSCACPFKKLTASVMSFVDGAKLWQLGGPWVLYFLRYTSAFVKAGCFEQAARKCNQFKQQVETFPCFFSDRKCYSFSW